MPSDQHSYFVSPDSVVRKIWGKSDIILFIFAGAAAEFSLNKAVDWLYFTGRLPKDPLGRLFSTVSYSRKIVFSGEEEAYKAIDTVRDIHAAVERARGALIPDWAYRDVLYLLVHYSIASWELFESALSDSEREEIYQVFRRVGLRMGLNGLPASYSEWLPSRAAHLAADLRKSDFTEDLFRQYRKHLGGMRFRVLIEAQKLIVPERVKELLQFRDFSLLAPAVPVYRISRLMKLDWMLKALLLPDAYKEQIKALDMSE